MSVIIHPCIPASSYILSGAGFDGIDMPDVRMVLIGANHMACRTSFFRDVDALQLTETFQFVHRLQNSSFMVPHFQPYKLVYAYILAEHGLVEESQK